MIIMLPFDSLFFHCFLPCVSFLICEFSIFQCRPGLINVDFADVRTIMGDAGTALMGIGRGSGTVWKNQFNCLLYRSILLSVAISHNSSLRILFVYYIPNLVGKANQGHKRLPQLPFHRPCWIFQ